MIEVPRGALTADEIAQHAAFFSFGTNDLTQMTFGYSRDDAEGGFLLKYVEDGILPVNPFQTLDDAVAGLMRTAVEKGRATRPDLELGHLRRARRRPGVDRSSASGSGSTTCRARRSASRSPGSRRRRPPSPARSATSSAVLDADALRSGHVPYHAGLAMPIDLGAFIESFQRGSAEIPRVAIALLLLAGPTSLLIGYRLISVARGRNARRSRRRRCGSATIVARSMRSAGRSATTAVRLRTRAARSSGSSRCPPPDLRPSRPPPARHSRPSGPTPSTGRLPQACR